MHDPLIVTVGTLLAVIFFALAVVEYHAHAQKEVQPVNWKDFGRILEQLAPVVLRVVPGVPPALVPIVAHGIQLAESIPNIDGPQKKAVVLGLVNTAITATNTAAGATKIDPGVINVVSNSIDAVIGAVNVVKKVAIPADADLALAPPA